jgi:hypothetical protein
MLATQSVAFCIAELLPVLSPWSANPVSWKLSVSTEPTPDVRTWFLRPANITPAVLELIQTSSYQVSCAFISLRIIFSAVVICRSAEMVYPDKSQPLAIKVMSVEPPPVSYPLWRQCSWPSSSTPVRVDIAEHDIAACALHVKMSII